MLYSAGEIRGDRVDRDRREATPLLEGAGLAQLDRGRAYREERIPVVRRVAHVDLGGELQSEVHLAEHQEPEDQPQLEPNGWPDWRSPALCFVDEVVDRVQGRQNARSELEEVNGVPDPDHEVLASKPGAPKERSGGQDEPPDPSGFVPKKAPLEVVDQAQGLQLLRSGSRARRRREGPRAACAR